jgi:hypothetical protein
MHCLLTWRRLGWLHCLVAKLACGRSSNVCFYHGTPKNDVFAGRHCWIVMIYSRALCWILYSILVESYWNWLKYPQIIYHDDRWPVDGLGGASASFPAASTPSACRRRTAEGPPPYKMAMLRSAWSRVRHCSRRPATFTPGGDGDVFGAVV